MMILLLDLFFLFLCAVYGILCKEFPGFQDRSKDIPGPL
jgi:hypothetical protein